MAMRRELREQDDGGEVQSGGADEDALRDASVVPDWAVISNRCQAPDNRFALGRLR